MVSRKRTLKTVLGNTVATCWEKVVQNWYNLLKGEVKNFFAGASKGLPMFAPMP